MDRDLYLIFTAKGLRTFVFGLVSVLLPLYLGFSSHTGSCCLTVIASSLFPRTPLGVSSGLGAFRATPGAPHLEYSVTYLLYMLIAVTTYKPT